MSKKCNHNPAINNAKRQGRYGWVENVYCSRCQKFVNVQVRKEHPENCGCPECLDGLEQTMGDE